MGAGITSGECSEQDTVNISQDAVSSWLHTPLDVSISTIVVPIIWCLGIITNLTFLFVIVRVRKLRSDTNIYLAHLSLADLLYLSMGSAYGIRSYTASVVARHGPFVNSAQCVSFFTVINTGYFASVALVTMVSFERFLALCHPIKHLKIRGRRRTHRMIAICWLVGLLFSASTVPRVLVLNVHCLQWPDVDAFVDYPSSYAYCGPVSPWVNYFIPPLLNIPWIVAMIANVFMYVRILQMLNKRTSNKNISVRKDHNATHIRNQVTKMLVANGTVFFLCQAPYRIFSLSGWICLLAQIPDPFVVALGSGIRWISSVPQFINAMINPLIYGAVNPAYRSAIRVAFKCKSQARRQNTSVSVVRGTEQNNTTSLAIDEDIETRL
ncbi:neuropeptides capa receptor-like [Patiria miniata]|uniref:G-protein coupled receptors family 1 profile domain-containing protein n=1 Tax=Patiria miniata TaxID=46514 RepID=A0A913Z8T0_PATMI|nr:neuropeptides capa receptor-like [Patiria miniata]